MADYRSPTVVTPSIPEADMTALERVILTAIFEHEYDADHIYLFSRTGPGDFASVDRDELMTAFEASGTIAGSTVTALVAEKLREMGDQHDAEERWADLELSGTPWASILQDIVRRSPTLDEIVETTAFTCTRMRPDGFGGAVTRITAEGATSRSTVDMLEALRAEEGEGQRASGA